jgi:hypothetical protein
MVNDRKIYNEGSSAGTRSAISEYAGPIHPIWVGPIESIGESPALSIISRCSALLSSRGPYEPMPTPACAHLMITETPMHADLYSGVKD